MSQLKDVIKRIANYVEKNTFLEGNPLEKLYLHHPPKRNKTPYRLTDRQIAQATADYPFHLPKELLELYTLGNGCLPATSRTDCDWNSSKSYFVLPDTECSPELLTLTRAVEYSKLFTEYYKDDAQKLFPIFSGFEGMTWAAYANEAECLQSPIVFFQEEPRYPYPAWPNLTSFLLAWIEVKEQRLKVTDNAEIEQIGRRYGGSWDGRCEGAALLYLTSFDYSDDE